MRLFQPTVSVERRLSTEIVKQSFTDLTKPETDQTEQEVEQEARGEALMMIEAATSSFRREELLKEKAEKEAVFRRSVPDCVSFSTPKVGTHI